MSIETGPAKQIHLEFDDPSLLPLLFGEHDRNLARIEQKLKVSLSSFGNTLRISGDEESAPVAQKTIEALYTGSKTIAARARRRAQLDFGVVDAAVKFANSEVEPGAFNGTAVVDTWKRATRPHPDPEDVHRGAGRWLVFGLGPAGTGKTYLAVAVAVVAQGPCGRPADSPARRSRPVSDWAFCRVI